MATADTLGVRGTFTCRTCDKVAYMTKTEAKKAAVAFGGQYKKSYREYRADCGNWHLTTQSTAEAMMYRRMAANTIPDEAPEPQKPEVPVTGTALEVFRYEKRDVRVVMQDGEPWWVAADVCAVLGLDDTHQALRGLDDDERNTTRIVSGKRGNPNRAIVNEPGLYSLILHSRRPEAKAFKRWITHEVIPSIRKTGAYVDPVVSETPVRTRESSDGVAALVHSVLDRADIAKVTFDPSGRVEVEKAFREIVANGFAPEPLKRNPPWLVDGDWTEVTSYRGITFYQSPVDKDDIRCVHGPTKRSEGEYQIAYTCWESKTKGGRRSEGEHSVCGTHYRQKGGDE